MANSENVIEYVRMALARPLVSAQEVAAKHRFKMPLDWFRSQPAEWHSNVSRRPFVYRDHDPLKRELASLIKRGFGHFAANPSRAGNVAAHQKTYVFAGDNHEFDDSENVQPVNWNPTTVDEFVNALIKAALKARGLYEERYFPQRSGQQDLSTEKLHQSALLKWALLGDRGVGKTAYLNYMLATRTTQLHKHRVIWVRIDLTKEYEDRLTLENIIQWQTLQILFRYYDLTTRNEDLHKLGPGDETIAHWMDKMNNDLVFDLSGDNRDLFQFARAMVPGLTLDVFRHSLTSARASFLINETAREVSGWIFVAIWNFLTIKLNVSFLIIIDGLDQLGLSNRDKKRFDRWHSQVYATLFQEGTLAAAFLITMRYQSWNNELSDDRFRRGFQRVSILPVPSKRIWDQKLAYLKDRSAFSRNWTIAKALDTSSYGDFIEAFCTAYMEFASYSLSAGIKGEGASTNIVEGFARLDEIFGNNRRKVFEALTNTVEFFVRIMPDEFDRLLNGLVAQTGARHLDNGLILTKETLPSLSRYQYLFIESLMLEQPEHSIREPHYTMAAPTKEGPRQFRSNGKQEFIFNIFACPFFRGVEKNIMLLYGLRLIQLFDAEASPIEKDEALQFLLDNFGYDEEMLECTFEELVDAGVLSHMPTAEFTFPNTIELTNRGQYLNRRLINSLEYLNLALQAAPLPAYLVDRGLFPIRRYACSEYALFNKVIATTNFVRLAKQIEAHEEERFNSTLGSTSEFSYRRYKAGKFAFAEEMAGNVLSAIEHMVRSAWIAGGPLRVQFERLVTDDLLGVR